MGLIQDRLGVHTTLLEILNSTDDWNTIVHLSGLTVTNITQMSFDITESNITKICNLDGVQDMSFLNENDIINLSCSYNSESGFYYKSVGIQKIEIV